MKPQTETELSACRAVAKDIIKKSDDNGWRKLSRDKVSELVANEVNLQAMLTGIDSLWIKSTMMRIQDGRM
jgi:hypothetical protein